MTPLGVKACEKSEFEIFEAKNTSLIQRRPVYWSEKLQKCDFAPFGLKMCRKRKSVVFRRKYVIFSKFRVDIQLFLNPRNSYKFPFGFPAHFYLVFRQKSHFCDFLFQYKALPKSGEAFFASKMSNSNSPHVFTPMGHFQKKISRGWPPPLLCSSSLILSFSKFSSKSQIFKKSKFSSEIILHQYRVEESKIAVSNQIYSIGNTSKFQKLL